MKLRFSLLLNVASLPSWVSFLHSVFLYPPTLLIWRTAPDVLSHGPNSVVFTSLKYIESSAWVASGFCQALLYDDLQKLLKSMCFKLYAQKDDIAVWQKASDSSCYNKLDVDAYPPKCDDSTEPDAAWYIPLRSCLVTPDKNLKKIGLTSTPKWPDRLHVAPERINAVPGASASAVKHDDSKWKVRVKHYKTLLLALGTDQIQNVMDMNTY